MPLDDLLSYFADWTGDEPPAEANLCLEGRGAHGRFRGLRLHSVFQALFSAREGHPVAHEALLRVVDASGQALTPAQAFAIPRNQPEVVYFDRLCRMVHAVNFVSQVQDDTPLFLNVSGRHLLSIGEGGHGEIFERLLAHCGLHPRQIVLEILESRVDDHHHLQHAVEAYQRRGYRVAIDDFGCRHSNFDRLWQLSPDIVKLDRSLILQADTNPRARRILPKLIDIIHDLGAQAVCEGIETPLQHALAVDAGTDLVQGFYYARPAARLMASPLALAPRSESASAPAPAARETAALPAN